MIYKLSAIYLKKDRTYLNIFKALFKYVRPFSAHQALKGQRDC